MSERFAKLRMRSFVWLLNSERRPSEFEPRVVSISMVKNEADVIEPFVRHNLQFVDAMFILENGSVDTTREILLEMEREGLPLVIIDDPVVGYAQGQKMTRLLAAITSTVFPEFVVPLDADEFIRCESRPAFDQSLEAIAPGGSGTIEWVTYVLTPSQAADGVSNPPRDMTIRRTTEDPPYSKTILRTAGAYVPQFAFAQGNHSVSRIDDGSVDAIPVSGVALGHFPVRSAEQLESKAIVGWMGNLLHNPRARPRNVAYQWRDAFDAAVAGDGIDPDQVAKASLLYAQTSREIDWDEDVVADPMQFSYKRRYDRGSEDSTLSIVARSWEASIQQPRSLIPTIQNRINERLSRDRTDSPSSRSVTVFDDDWHLERPYVDVPPLRYLAEKYSPNSVLDIGCGLGAYLLVFKEFADSAVCGVEGFGDGAALLKPEEFVTADITEGLDLARKFDLVICMEVLEHIDAKYEATVLDGISRHARELILFTAGDENQPGHGHINCRPVDHWLRAWRARGWEPILFDTLAFRAIATFSWLRRNPLILARVGAGRGRAELLRDIGARQYRWYDQEPEVIDYALSQDVPHDVYRQGF